MADIIRPGNSMRPTQVTRRTVPTARTSSAERAEHAAPPRPNASFIPTPDVLQGLIDRALAALSKGIMWDRGSIINILL